MGALHEGHLSLVRRSRAENDRTLVSIFVNPTQFDDPADYAQYPRTLEADLEVLRPTGADFVLLPARGRSVPGWLSAIASPRSSSRSMLEGAHRPGHFDAVLTVVLKLLQIAAADRAYFGEKDWQQLRLVRGMADAFFLPTAIVACPTVRECRRPGAQLAQPPPVRGRSSAGARVPPGAGRLRDAPTRRRARCARPDSTWTTSKTSTGRRLGAVRLGDVRLSTMCRSERRS